MELCRLASGTERHRAAMRFDAEDKERQSHQQHAKSKKEEGRKHRVRRSLRRHEIAGARDQRKTQWSNNLANAVCRLTETGGSCAHPHAIALHGIGREVREAAFCEGVHRKPFQGPLDVVSREGLKAYIRPAVTTDA